MQEDQKFYKNKPAMTLARLYQSDHQFDVSYIRHLLSKITFISFILLFTSATTYAQTKVPLYYGENKNYRGENAPVADKFTRIFSRIEKDLGIQFQLQIYPWNRAVKMASTEGGLIFGLSKTPERENIFNFSTPVFYNNLWLVTRSDAQFKFKTLHDLKGKVIGVVQGYKYGGEFDAQRNILFKTDEDIDSYVPRLKKVLNRQIDAMIFASSLTDTKELEKMVNAIEISTSENRPLTGPAFSVLPVSILKDGIHFAILRGENDDLINRINKSLKKNRSFNARALNSKK
jgi:polar amino acid transport system substrate-binding protein